MSSFLFCGCHRLHATLLDGGGGGRRREEFDERFGPIHFLGANGDGGREHGDFLYLGRQRADKINARHGQQLADLLEGDLDFAPRDQGARRFFWRNSEPKKTN
jgi:hypothetical protein